METIERPEFITNDHLAFLDDLRDSGATNMFGARKYIYEEFPELSKEQAGEVLSYWMKTFSSRKKD